jgi:hypothetical protein
VFLYDIQVDGHDEVCEEAMDFIGGNHPPEECVLLQCGADGRYVAISEEDVIGAMLAAYAADGLTCTVRKSPLDHEAAVEVLRRYLPEDDELHASTRERLDELFSS